MWQYYHFLKHNDNKIGAEEVRFVQTGSGAHPASYPVGTSGSFPGGKAAGA